jgi:hypothetical protein
MTRYMLLIAEGASTIQPGDPDWDAMMGEYNAFSGWLREQGWMLGGDALQPPETATTVQVRDGRRIVTDGPFAETKEQLGGYYVVDVPSLDDALEAAARIPGARMGRIEVREIAELG